MANIGEFYCAELSRSLGEDIVGSAGYYQTYILIECPYPWESQAFESPKVPKNLQAFISEVEQAKLSVRFLLMVKDKCKADEKTKVIVYQQPQKSTTSYEKQEFDLPNIGEVAPLLANYLTPEGFEFATRPSESRDFFVCTHGSRDRCCARYGYPFYRQAVEMSAELGLEDVDVWQVSHIGGHRFAPTMIAFPDGRYYGALTSESLRTILTRQGDLSCFEQVYRGWSLLPKKMQVLERELMLHHGWQWYDYDISYRILQESSDPDWLQVELYCQQPNGDTLIYQADIVVNEDKTLYSQGSCSSQDNSKLVKYQAKNLKLVTNLAKMTA